MPDPRPRSLDRWSVAEAGRLERHVRVLFNSGMVPNLYR